MTEPHAAQPFTAPSIVVGIDGSRTATHAAVWAIDETLGRDLPLRLVAVSETADPGRARKALSEAADAVAATGSGVAVQTTTVLTADDPVHALLEASRAAVMLCVGGSGSSISTPTASDPMVAPTPPTLWWRRRTARWPWCVVRIVPADGWWSRSTAPRTAARCCSTQSRRPGCDELRCRVLGTWQSDGTSAGEAEHLVRAQLDRRLEQWHHRYPDLDVVPVAVHGSGLGYLTEHAAAIQLVVIGCHNTEAVDELLGLRHTDYSVLVIDPQRLL